MLDPALLRSRLAETADRLADVDDRAARQVAPIAFAADAALALAGQDRAHLHRIDAGALDGVGARFLDHLPGLDDLAAGQRIDHGFGGEAADDTVEQRDRKSTRLNSSH